jgi:hypothetical protein
MMTENESNQPSEIPSVINPFSLDDLLKHISRILSLNVDQKLPASIDSENEDDLTSSKDTSEIVIMRSTNMNSI